MEEGRKGFGFLHARRYSKENEEEEEAKKAFKSERRRRKKSLLSQKDFLVIYVFAYRK